MRLAARFILFFSLFLSTIGAARADAVDGGFEVGVWRGSPMVTDGSFASCGMLALFGQKDAPVMLTIGLDRLQGWIVSISSDQFKLPTGHIKASFAFDDEAPVDVQGEIKGATMMSFKFPTTALLDRHAEARKLVLIFKDVALPFVLPQFAEATKALRACIQANSDLAAEPLAAVQATTAELPSQSSATFPAELAAANPRLFSELVGPMIVGFVGSVLLVLLAGGILFEIVRARARYRYSRLWSAEYRATKAPALALGLLEPIARHPADTPVAA